MQLAKEIRDRLLFLRPWMKRGDAVHTVANMTFAGDGMITRHDVSQMQDPRFRRIHNAAFWGLTPQPFHDHLSWRIHIVTWAATLAVRSVPGALVEFGVNYGIFSRAICEAIQIDSTDRKFILVDSWGKMEGSHPAYAADIYAQVRDRFRAYQAVTLVRGTVPAVLRHMPDCDQIAYLSLDMNDGYADHDALQWAWPRIAKGGVIYVDDWGWDYPELRRLVGGFVAQQNCEVLVFPTGNAIVVKV